MSLRAPFCPTCHDTGDENWQAAELWEHTLDARADERRLGLDRGGVLFRAPEVRPCRDCPVCAVCGVPLSSHDPGTYAWQVVTRTPYGHLQRWHVADQCGPEPIERAGWLKGLAAWETWVNDTVVRMDKLTGTRRGPGSRVI